MNTCIKVSVAGRPDLISSNGILNVGNTCVQNICVRAIWGFTPLEPSGYYMNHHTPEIRILYCCVLYGCQDKRRVFPYTALTNVYITETERVYCAVRT